MENHKEQLFSDLISNLKVDQLLHNFRMMEGFRAQTEYTDISIKVILENKTRKGVIFWNDQGKCKLEIFDKDDNRIFFEQRELFLEEDFYYICNRMVYVLYNKVYRIIDNNTMEIEHPIIIRIIGWIGLPILLAISIWLFSELFVNERYLDFFAIISCPFGKQGILNFFEFSYG